jgi:hypothetical protein
MKSMLFHSPSPRVVSATDTIIHFQSHLNHCPSSDQRQHYQINDRQYDLELKNIHLLFQNYINSSWFGKAYCIQLYYQEGSVTTPSLIRSSPLHYHYYLPNTMTIRGSFSYATLKYELMKIVVIECDQVLEPVVAQGTVCLKHFIQQELENDVNISIPIHTLRGNEAGMVNVTVKASVPIDENAQLDRNLKADPHEYRQLIHAQHKDTAKTMEIKTGVYTCTMQF